MRRLAQRLALSAGRRLDEAQPWVDGQLTGLGTGDFTVRLHAVLPPIAAAGTCLSLRVLRPATQDLAALDVAPAPSRPTWPSCSRDHRRPTGVPRLRRHGRRQDDAVVRRLGRRSRRRTHRLRRGRGRTRAAPPASGQAGRPLRQRRRRRRGDGARSGPAGAADATGPDRRRRGPRRRGRRPAWPRLNTGHDGRRGHGARQQPGRGAGAARGARGRSAASTARRCTASWPRPCRWCCTSAVTEAARAGSSEIAVLERGDDGCVGWSPPGTSTPDSAAVWTV